MRKATLIVGSRVFYTTPTGRFACRITEKEEGALEVATDSHNRFRVVASGLTASWLTNAAGAVVYGDSEAATLEDARQLEEARREKAGPTTSGVID